MVNTENIYYCEKIIEKKNQDYTINWTKILSKSSL